MPKTWSDEAIVLRSFNVGETDRFYVLLTRARGRITARANGVRRIKSRRGMGLLPLHRVHLTCEQRSAGNFVTAVDCLDAHAATWHDPHVFSCANQGIELILKLIEEGEPVGEIFELTCDFLKACSAPHSRLVAPFFSLKLLHLLGSLPSATHSAVSHLPFKSGDRLVVGRLGGLSLRTEDRGGVRITPELQVLLQKIPIVDLKDLPACPAPLIRDLERFLQGLLGNQLGVELKSPAVSRAISSGVTPI